MKNKKIPSVSIATQSISILFGGLTPDRKEKIKALTRNLLDLSIKSETIDAVLAAVIVEALEVQMNQTGSSVPPERESSLKLTKSLFGKEENSLKKEKASPKKKTRKDTN